MRSVHSVDTLNFYYKNGLPLIKLFKYKNYALQYFVPDVLKLLINFKNSYPYLIEIFFFYLKNCYYPNLYLSIFYQLGRSIKKYFNEKNCEVCGNKKLTKILDLGKTRYVMI